MTANTNTSTAANTNDGTADAQLIADKDLKTTFAPPERVSEKAHLSSMDTYTKWYNESITSPCNFWDRVPFIHFMYDVLVGSGIGGMA